MAKKGLSAGFSGQKELMENMRNLSEEMRMNVKRGAIMEAANYLKEESTRRVPVRTGKLKENIITQTVEDNERVTEVKVGPSRDGFYGGMIEYGTKKMKAQPFMRPAFDENGDRVDEIISRKIQEGIDKAVKTVDSG
jgi:HK97 gp10 family phage protein